MIPPEEADPICEHVMVTVKGRQYYVGNVRLSELDRKIADVMTPKEPEKK